MKMNSMREIKIEKVTINVGVGSPGERLENIKNYLEKLIGTKFIETKAKKRNPTFKLRPGLPIGLKTTLRGKKALEFLNKALDARKRKLSSKMFDNFGNFSFGVKEYIDFPGAKYDPKIGIFGFDVCVTLSRKGKRVELRRRKKSKVGKKHLISKNEGIEFAKNKLGVKIEEGG